MRKFDYLNFKNYNWDSEILKLVSEIHEYKGRQDLFINQRAEALENLVKIAKIQSTENSNKIEGIVTTSTRLKQLCEEKTTPQSRDEEEIMGYRDVLNIIHENYNYIPINKNYILQLHNELHKYSDKSFRGKFKNTQNVITKTDMYRTSVLFTPLSPYETPIAINDICDNYNKAIDNDIVDSLLLIPIFINDFLCIHPFNDGNGRMSRLLTTLLLYRQGYVVGKYISIESKIEKTKIDYYDVLQKSDMDWYSGNNDYIPFIKYMLRIILSAYRDFEDRVNIFENKLPAIEQVKSAINRKIGKFTKAEILEMTPGIKRSSVEKALKRLVEENFIEMCGKGKLTFYVRKND